jgi:hypothetical protein
MQLPALADHHNTLTAIAREMRVSVPAAQRMAKRLGIRQGRAFIVPTDVHERVKRTKCRVNRIKARTFQAARTG